MPTAQMHSLVAATVDRYYEHVRATVLTQTMFLKVLCHRISEEPCDDHAPFHDEDDGADSEEHAVTACVDDAPKPAPSVIIHGRLAHAHRRRVAEAAAAQSHYDARVDDSLTPEQLFPLFT